MMASLKAYLPRNRRDTVVELGRHPDWRIRCNNQTPTILTVSSWLVFNQPPDMWFFIGLPIVVGSGLYIWLRERQLSKSLTTATPIRD